MPVDAAHNEVEIRYCPKCRWLMRSAWMAQELRPTGISGMSTASNADGAGALA